jgi:tetratricopeptide (TPR) repeat protein
MRRVLLTAVYFLLVFALSAQNAKKQFRTAKKLVEAGQYQAGINKLNQAIELNKTFNDAYLLRAEAFEKLGNYEQAAANYEKVASLNSAQAAWFFHTGRLYFLSENYQRAIIFLNHASTLEAKYPELLLFKAKAYLANKEFVKALVAVETALRDEVSYEHYYVRALAYDSLKKYPQAIDSYRQALELNSGQANIYYDLIRSLLNNKQLDEALTFAQRATQLFPYDAEAYKVRSLVYYQRRELFHAINDLSKLETLTNDLVPILCTRGKYYFEFEQFQNAKSDFTQVLYKNPEHSTALYWRARSNEELMELDLARNDYEQFLSTTSVSNTGWYNDAQQRLFVLNRETVAPQITILHPLLVNDNKLAVENFTDSLEVRGQLTDRSGIKQLFINKQPVKLLPGAQFVCQISLKDISQIEFIADDVYNNRTELSYDLVLLEKDRPKVKIRYPEIDSRGAFHIDNQANELKIEGWILDSSHIKEIWINERSVSFNKSVLNPGFSIRLTGLPIDTITIKAIDVFNNETTLYLSRHQEN